MCGKHRLQATYCMELPQGGDAAAEPRGAGAAKPSLHGVSP